MYLLQLDETNAVVTVVQTAYAPLLTALSDRHMLAVVAPEVGQTFDPTTQLFAAPPRKRWVTKLAFWNRMTQGERINIDLVSERPVQLEGELAADFETSRANAAALRDMRTQLDAASYIDLERTDTRGGVQALESMGLLAVGRALAILDGPITEAEFYRDA